MANFQVDKTAIQGIRSLIEGLQNSQLQKKLNQLHYADIAEIIQELSIDEAVYIIKLLNSAKTADALAELDEDIREGILKQLSVKEIVGEIEELDTDDAADLLSELPEARQEKVFDQINDETLADDLRELLNYEENTAGGLMAKELVKVQEDLSVLKCLNTMRAQAENVTRVHSIYVVDSKNRLKEGYP